MNTFEIRRAWCKGCRICVVFCPKQALELDAEGKLVHARPEDCVYCGMCALRCPDLALTVVRAAKGRTNDE